jgi:DNA-binding response OmpR family regulator
MVDTRARPSVTAARCKRGTVLVIDDDAWIRSVIADFLSTEGFMVEQAPDATSGLRMAELVEPAVILLDLALPMRSGLEVLQQLRDRQPTREIPIIIVSAYAMLLVGHEACRTGGVPRKPLDLKNLLARVNQAVRRAHPKFRLLPPTTESAGPRA